MKPVLKRSNAPIFWSLFGAGGMLAALFGPALVYYLLSFAIFDDLTRPALVIAMFIGLELFSYLVLEPWLYGSRTGVSPIR